MESVNQNRPSFSKPFYFCFFLAVSTSVKQQYHDNIRWIQEAGRHNLVNAQPLSSLMTLYLLLCHSEGVTLSLSFLEKCRKGPE